MITQQPLSYSFSDLEPTIDAKTMEIHITKHVQAYIDNTNTILNKYPELQKLTLEKILTDIESLPISEPDRVYLKNNAGGVANHVLYFSIMGPEKELNHPLIERITKTFGSLDAFKDQVSTLAIKHFGSGWAWLVEDEKKDLKIYSLPNQNSPYTLGHTPILALDVWEHAYYLTYQNRRAEYVKNWWNVLKIL
ncbi:MAG: Superoxide dismutase [Microgenomates group bacterium GW2011_GWB1_40_9]|nr:MAG: Superoxide dismutase [Microgenomates group bacterium GW2011_GWC1_39_12]KKR79159.1 MAG: Superoxide dismutase [Microgenomates group bacterium GW2011_GWB1_40_9]